MNIAILTSNSKNTENIIQHFLNNDKININCVISNHENKDFLSKLRRYKTKNYVQHLYKEIDKILVENNIHFIILDGWHELIPVNFCKKYTNKIINIRTYDNKSKHFGIVIYFINHELNKGEIIFYKLHEYKENIDQYDVDVIIDKFEKKYYPNIIEKTIMSYVK